MLRWLRAWWRQRQVDRRLDRLFTETMFARQDHETTERRARLDRLQQRDHMLRAQRQLRTDGYDLDDLHMEKR